MKKENMEVIFYDLCKEIISMTNEVDLKKIIQDIDTSDLDEYSKELVEELQEEIYKYDHSYTYIIDILEELSSINEFLSVQTLLEDKIEPEDGIFYCPQCSETIKLHGDDYFECECGWTTNY